MPSAAGSILLDASGNRVLNADGSIRLSDGTSDDCDCCANCIPDVGEGVIRHAANPNDYGFDSFPLNLPCQEQFSWPCCHRLCVWERRTVTGGVYGGAGAYDHILKTNARGYRGHIGSGGPLPFETAPGSGIDLDTEPYWWSGCLMGGYATGAATWYNPTLAEVLAYSTAAATLVNGTYTLLAVVRFRHAAQNAFCGGALVIPENDGQVRVGRIRHVKH